jgi:hypothetical protein
VDKSCALDINPIDPSPWSEENSAADEINVEGTEDR